MKINYRPHRYLIGYMFASSMLACSIVAATLLIAEYRALPSERHRPVVLYGASEVVIPETLIVIDSGFPHKLTHTAIDY